MVAHQKHDSQSAKLCPSECLIKFIVCIVIDIGFWVDIHCPHLLCRSMYCHYLHS